MKFKFFLIIIFLISYLCLLDNSFSQKDIINNETIENISLKSYFCRDIDCEELYLELFDNASKVNCAFFDFDLIDMKNSLDKLYKENKEVLVLVDGDNDIFNDSDYILFDKRSAYMHNKFCIVDDKLISGSFNPTINGRDKNDNNIVVIEDEDIVNIYEDYFKTLIRELTDKNYKHSKDNRNYRIKNVEICFSRGGNCLDKIKTTILKANHSINFLTFSFTDNDIGNLLLYKKYLENVYVEGVFETTSISKYSEYNKLMYQLSNDSILKDCNKGKLHHKVFVIDNETVITGSFNPSNNADNNNDENMLIIKDKELAENYIKEFERIRLLCMT